VASGTEELGNPARKLVRLFSFGVRKNYNEFIFATSEGRVTIGNWQYGNRLVSVRFSSVDTMIHRSFKFQIRRSDYWAM
jgi:hypothetical protein